MLTDHTQVFDRMFDASRKEADGLAQGAIRELFLGPDGGGCEIREARYERVLNWFRFQPPANAVKAGAVMLLTLIFSALAARSLRPLLGPDSELIYLIPALLVEIFCLTYIPLSVVLPDRAWSTVTPAERKLLTARLLAESWLARKYDLDDLLPALRSSADKLRSRRSAVVWPVSAVGTLVAYLDLFAGPQAASRNGLFSLLGIPAGYRVPVFCVTAAALGIVALVKIFAPLRWREQLEPHLVREVEKRKAERSRAE